MSGYSSCVMPKIRTLFLLVDHQVQIAVVRQWKLVGDGKWLCKRWSGFRSMKVMSGYMAMMT